MLLHQSATCIILSDLLPFGMCSEMHLAEARQIENEDAVDEELPSTSGRPFGEVSSF